MAASSPTPSPCQAQRVQAYQLRDALRSGDADALRRARAVFGDLAGLPDAAVPGEMGLARCQHVIAREHGAVSWAEISARTVPTTVWPSLWTNPDPHLAVIGFDARRLNPVVRTVLAAAAAEHDDTHLCILRWPGGNIDPHEFDRGPFPTAPIWANPAIGTRFGAITALATILQCLLEADGEPTEPEQHRAMQDAICEAFRQRVSDIPFRTEADRREADGVGWIEYSRKWFLIEPPPPEVCERFDHNPYSPANIVAVDQLEPRPGLDAFTPSSLRSSLPAEATRWLFDSRWHIAAGAEAFQCPIAGSVLISDGGLARPVLTCAPEALRNRVEATATVLAIACSDAEALVGAVAAGIRLKPGGDGVTDPRILFNRGVGFLRVQREVWLDDIVRLLWRHETDPGAAGVLERLSPLLTATPAAWPLKASLPPSRLSKTPGSTYISTTFQRGPNPGRSWPASLPAVGIIDLAIPMRIAPAIRDPLGMTALRHLFQAQEERTPSGYLTLVVDGYRGAADSLVAGAIREFARAGRSLGMALVWSLDPEQATDTILREPYGHCLIAGTAVPSLPSDTWDWLQRRLAGEEPLDDDDVVDVHIASGSIAIRTLPDLRLRRTVT